MFRSFLTSSAARSSFHCESIMLNGIDRLTKFKLSSSVVRISAYIIIIIGLTIFRQIPEWNFD